MRIYDAELRDDYFDASPRTARRRDDDYQKWTEIPARIIAEYSSALSFFDPTSFRFHIPAYMTWALDNYNKSNSYSGDSAIYSLLLNTDDDELRAYSLERFETFDEPQREAIVLFLRFAVEADDYLDGLVALQALDAYWDLD